MTNKKHDILIESLREQIDTNREYILQLMRVITKTLPSTYNDTIHLSNELNRIHDQIVSETNGRLTKLNN